MDARCIRILALSGSLRSASSNSVILRSAARLAPEELQIKIFADLGNLPHFNPDLDIDPALSAVADFRRQLREADAVLISSPEYAHGVPGVLKNALDWLVRRGEFVDKPTAIIDNLPRGEWALASLRETLSVMMARLSAQTSFTFPLAGNTIVEADILNDAARAEILRGGLERLADFVRKHSAEA